MILQMKQKVEFWKIGPCIFKDVTVEIYALISIVIYSSY